MIDRDVVLRRYTLICNGEVWRVNFDELGEDHHVGPFRGGAPCPSLPPEEVQAGEQVLGNASSSSHPSQG